MTKRDIDATISDLEFSLGGIDPRSWHEVDNVIDKLKRRKAALRKPESRAEFDGMYSSDKPRYVYCAGVKRRVE